LDDQTDGFFLGGLLDGAADESAIAGVMTSLILITAACFS